MGAAESGKDIVLYYYPVPLFVDSDSQACFSPVAVVLQGILHHHLYRNRHHIGVHSVQVPGYLGAPLWSCFMYRRC